VRHLTAIALTLVVGVAAADRPNGRSGAATYDRYCAACHGDLGDGRGPAAPFTWSAPRSFVKGEYKWQSTPLGQAPTDDDLRTTIRFGAPGTSMHAFGDVLSTVELASAITRIKAFDPPLFANATPHVFNAGPTRPQNRERGDELWTKSGCATCHGADGKGDGPAAIHFKPYDLTALPLRRPRAHDVVDSRRRAAVTSIALGVAGTQMPSYALPEADLWALADHVVELGKDARRHGIALDDEAIARDRDAPLDTAIWLGTGSDAAIWGQHLAAQGTPPVTLAPAQASLSAKQCGRCHAKQFREWTGSLHGAAGSPGLYAQLDAGMKDTCRRCHAPLAEQAPGNVYDGALRDEGVTCASCHVRAWTRNGPGASATLLADPAYPKQDLAIYERGDFCMPCHQLPPRNGLGGKPLLNTYKEWLEGPYMQRGIQCQHCHMPNREHQWLGIHDKDTFRQGIRLDVDARRTDRGASVVAELANIGAGHYLPTTPTPAVWLRIELLDRDGHPIEGARDETRIGRDLWFDGTWHERADTRIPPGEKVTFVKAWRDGRAKQAAVARVTVEVWPDDYYEKFYKQRLATNPPAAIRAEYERAQVRASGHYIAEQRDVQLSH
jgi:mono/diheme cytochrome c family protein/ribosomal protein L40E